MLVGEHEIQAYVEFKIEIWTTNECDLSTGEE